MSLFLLFFRKIHILGSFSNIKIARTAICNLILGMYKTKTVYFMRWTVIRDTQRQILSIITIILWPPPPISVCIGFGWPSNTLSKISKLRFKPPVLQTFTARLDVNCSISRENFFWQTTNLVYMQVPLRSRWPQLIFRPLIQDWDKQQTCYNMSVNFCNHFSSQEVHLPKCMETWGAWQPGLQRDSDCC